MIFLNGFLFCLSVISMEVLCTETTTKSVTVGGTSSSEESTKQVDNYASEMIKNDKIREVYVKCLLDKGPCSQEAGEIKKLVPEAVEKGCKKCTEIQQKIIEKMMLYLKEKQPEILQQVTIKFDPKGNLINNFISKLQQQNNQEIHHEHHRNQQKQNENESKQKRQ